MSVYKKGRYDHVTHLIKTVKYLEGKYHTDIQCFHRFIHVDKVQEWSNLINNYFEFKSRIKEYSKVQILIRSINEDRGADHVDFFKC